VAESLVGSRSLNIKKFGNEDSNAPPRARFNDTACRQCRPPRSHRAFAGVDTRDGADAARERPLKMREMPDTSE
jgi:hypothetical protein